jgi:hypothetical protein
MKTRSQIQSQPDTIVKPIELEVNIDFDDSIRMWNSNKKKQLNGCFTYVCGAELKNGNFCKNRSCIKHNHKPNQHNF